MKKIADEFKKFALRGNMIDMAVGIIIGGAFGTIVNSLVNDIVMPPFGHLLGGIDFSQLYINLSGGQFESLAQAREAQAATINYGLFINNIISFLIVAISVFLMIKFMNSLKREEVKPKPEKSEKECPYCFTNINRKAARCPNCTSSL